MGETVLSRAASLRAELQAASDEVRGLLSTHGPYSTERRAEIEAALAWHEAIAEAFTRAVRQNLDLMFYSLEPRKARRSRSSR